MSGASKARFPDQGEEWAASAPFLYFTAHEDAALANAVRKGRKCGVRLRIRERCSVSGACGSGKEE